MTTNNEWPTAKTVDDHGPKAAVSAARTEDAVKQYGTGATAVRALDGITLGFDRGTFSSIMGPSGSGKSTLLHCMAGLDDLTSGSVFLGEIRLGDLSENELTLLRREKVGFVFQSYNLIPTMTAMQNIELPQKLAGHRAESAWLDEVVAMVGLEKRRHHRPSELSGGEQQRVAVARALASRPEIIFADEPTGNLDSLAGHEVLEFLRSAVDDLAQTVVMVTHDPMAAAYTERVVFLQDGQVTDELLDPSADRILDRMRQFEVH